MSLLRQGKAQMLTLYLGESDQWKGEQLSVAILQMLREAGCAGATVTRAIAGYGAGARLRELHIWPLSSDAPLIIHVVDQPERLQRLIPRLQEMMQGGLMTLEETNVLKYTHARRQGISPKVPVRQIMDHDPVTVTMETPVSEIVPLLLSASFELVPVVDANHQLHGIISAGDLVSAGLIPFHRELVQVAQTLDQQTTEAISASLDAIQQGNLRAQDIMNSQIHTVYPEQSIRDAAQVMIDTGVRNLPVVSRSGLLCGMITRSDLLQAIRTSPLMSPEAESATQPLPVTKPLPGIPPQQQPISSYMTTDVATVEVDTPFSSMIDALMTSPLKRVIVVDQDQHVKGIISDIDVLMRMQADMRPHLLAVLMGWAQGKPARVPTGALRSSTGKKQFAADVMNATVHTIAGTASVQDAVELMKQMHYKWLPVVDKEQHLIGAVGRTSLLRVLLENKA